MANREENLKKINAELEQMSDAELDQVAGGTWAQTLSDSRFLNKLNQSVDRCRPYFSPKDIEEEVKRGWARFGIDFTAHDGTNTDNEYYLNGKKISQSEARKHAMQVTGKVMDVKDWDW